MFQDDAGRPHKSILECLQANKFIAIRGVIQEQHKNETVTIGDVVKLLDSQGHRLIHVIKQYDKAMTKERTKANPLPPA